MGLGPRSIATDLFVLGSSVYHSRQINKETRRLEGLVKAQSQHLWQQKAISQFVELNRRNLIEKRKLLVRYDSFAERSSEIYGEYPEYATMMIEYASNSLSNNNLKPDDFDDLPDMERANQINHKVTRLASEMRQDLTEEQSKTVDQMVTFLEIEEDMMEEHAVLCKENEKWESMIEQFDETDSLRRARKEKLYIVSVAPLMVGIVGFIVWNIDPSALSSLSFIAAPGAFACLLAITSMWFWSRKYEKEWGTMNGQRLLVELSKDKYNILGNKFSTFSSDEIIAKRQKMKRWMDDITPSNSEKMLKF